LNELQDFADVNHYPPFVWVPQYEHIPIKPTPLISHSTPGTITAVTTGVVPPKKVTPVSEKTAITTLKINIFERFKNSYFPLS